MKDYLIYFKGLELKIWQKADSETKASKKLWDEFSDEQKNKIVFIDCIDEREITKWLLAITVKNLK